MKHVTIKSACVLLLACGLLLLTGSGKAPTTYPCPCGCEACTCQVTLGQPLFSLSKEHLVSVDFDYRSCLEGEDAEKAIDLINAFVPVRVDAEEGGSPIGAGGITVTYYDSRRDFVPLGDAIYVGKMKYIGEPGCLDALYQMFDQRAEQDHQQLVDSYIEEIRNLRREHKWKKSAE